MNVNWLSYDLTDFMLFSNRAYYRLFENINSQFWPSQFIFFILSLALAYYAINQSPLGNRIVAFILAGAWLFSGWFFIWKLYVNINWAAFWFVHLFLVQGIAFLILAVFFKGLELQRLRGFSAWMQFSILLFSILYIPGISIYLRGSVLSAEVFGMTPTPTAFATFALLGLSKFPGKLAFQVIPILWIFFSTMVLYALTQLGHYY